MTMDSKPVWFITGCSSGIGRALAKQTLAKGYPTVVTARAPSTLSEFAKEGGGQALILELDVTKPAQVTAATAAAIQKFGRIDILVNNAGIGYFGSVEESEAAETRRMFEINFWGLADMTRSLLPQFRKQRAGMIVNVSSLAGLASAPGLGYYCASKFAVEGLSEALALELAPLGVNVMLAEPGPHRTDWAGRSANEAPRTIADYDSTAGARLLRARGYSGKQPGDPMRAAEAIIAAVESPEPPQRLLLGKIAAAGAREKVAALMKDFERWDTVSQSTDFPET